MAIPEVEWRYVGSEAYSATIDSVLDAVYSLGTSTTYYDASTRTPGSASAGTYSRFQASGTTEAVYATPPTTTALAQKWIWAGSAGAKSPTMATPDTWATNNLLVSINKGSGAFASWDAASPFTSGNFFGYWKGWDTNDTSGNAHMWECEEAVMVALARSSNGSVHWHCLGAFINPVSTQAADAESDERLYGVGTSGTSSVTIVTGHPGGNTAWMGHGASNGHTHCGIFDSGAGTITTVKRNTSFSSNNQYSLALRSGDYIYQKNSIPMNKSSSSAQYCVGVLREMSYFNRATLGQVLSQGGTDIAYVIGEHASSGAEAALLFRNA
jgi:hypothetical protein